MDKDFILSATRKIESLCAEKSLEVSEVLKRAKLSARIIEDWKNFKVEPSIPALAQICDELGTELSVLFCDGAPKLTDEQQDLINSWKTLSLEEKEAIFHYITAMVEIQKKR